MYCGCIHKSQHFTTTDAEEQLSYAVEWKQNKELTLQCCLHVHCEAGYAVVVKQSGMYINY